MGRGFGGIDTVPLLGSTKEDVMSKYDWMDDAACAQIGTELFFVEKGSSIREAREICARCEVRQACLDYALSIDDPPLLGVWGGTNERERRRLRKTA